MLYVEQECAVELLYKKHFMVEKSAPQTGLSSVTQNHVQTKDLIPSTANGLHGVNVALPVDQGRIIEKLKDMPNLVGRSVLGMRLRIVTSNYASVSAPLTVNGGHGVIVVLLNVDLAHETEKSWKKPDLVERSALGMQ